MSHLEELAWLSVLLAGLFAPRVRLSVSEWSDLNRVLSPKASAEPGPWRTSRTPYLREIMDALSVGSDCARVVIMKSAQMGATEAASNWIGYIMDQVRTAKPTLIIVPTDKLLVRWRHQRLTPMIEGAECLQEKIDVTKSREGTNRLDLIDYPGGLLYLASAGSASNLKSDSICYVICDEADEYDWDVGGRGDPLALIESRQSNFPRRKTLVFSTPTVKGASRIEGEWDRSDQREYQVSCPHCGAHQVLTWEHLHWTADRSQVWYACAHSGCIIEEREKPQMLTGGRWVPAHPEREIRGYHLSALYAPLGLGYSWTLLVEQWLQAQGNELRLQAFVNERLGLPYEARRTRLSDEDLPSRAEPYPLRLIQPGVLLITAGVDTQDDRLELQLIGWGRAGHWWVLDYVRFPGDPGRPEVWTALQDYLGRPLATPAGTLASIEAVCIDMGGHKTEDVKAFVRRSGIRRLVAIQGSRYRLPVVLGAPKKIDYTLRGQVYRHGMQYFPVGTELAKDRLYGDLRADAGLSPADRKGHFSMDLTADYYAGLLSEVWNPKRNRYEKRVGATRRNEPLDTWVYALAAAYHPEIRLDKIRATDWDARERRLWPEIDSAIPSPPGPPPTVRAGPPRPARPRPAASLANPDWEL